jgi:hypothetical protein
MRWAGLAGRGRLLMPLVSEEGGFRAAIGGAVWDGKEFDAWVMADSYRGNGLVAHEAAVREPGAGNGQGIPEVGALRQFPTIFYLSTVNRHI